MSGALLPVDSASAAWIVPPPDPGEWPSLWARCWARIRTWRVPPRWSPAEWCREARAQGALAACEALRAFDPRRLVPRDAFLYRRVIESVWTRYRQEWRFARRARSDAQLADRPAPQAGGPDSELLERLAAALERLTEPERRLIRQLFWDERSEGGLAHDLGISRQAVNKRKQRVVLKLRRQLGAQ